MQGSGGRRAAGMQGANRYAAPDADWIGMAHSPTGSAALGLPGGAALGVGGAARRGVGPLDVEVDSHFPEEIECPPVAPGVFVAGGKMRAPDVDVTARVVEVGLGCGGDQGLAASAVGDGDVLARGVVPGAGDEGRSR